MVKFFSKEHLLSGLPNTVELSDEWFKKNFKYQDPYLYFRLFDYPENRPFEVFPGRTNPYKKTIPDTLKLYDFQENNSACEFC